MNREWILIGIPDHEAVINVGGRIGAARGPDAFRTAFKKLKGPDGVQESMTDGGNVAGLTSEVETNHRLASDLIRSALSTYSRSVIVGGGHDHGFSHLRGIALAGKRLGCINLDAHLDVRKPEPKITSGSPFWLAIENRVLKPEDLVEFGIQRHCNATELWDWIQKHKVPVIPFEKLRGGEAVSAFEKQLHSLSKRCDQVVISLDLDSAAQAFAPGVSAPQAEGFTSSEIIEMMEIAGKNPKVVSLGIFELNPEHDQDLKTARLAATAAYHWLAAGMPRAEHPREKRRR